MDRNGTENLKSQDDPNWKKSQQQNINIMAVSSAMLKVCWRLFMY